MHVVYETLAYLIWNFACILLISVCLNVLVRFLQNHRTRLETDHQLNLYIIQMRGLQSLKFYIFSQFCKTTLKNLPFKFKNLKMFQIFIELHIDIVTKSRKTQNLEDSKHRITQNLKNMETKNLVFYILKFKSLWFENWHRYQKALSISWIMIFLFKMSKKIQCI